MDHPGRIGIVATIELAKLQEHQFRDLHAASSSAMTGLRRADTRRHLGHPEPALERDLRRRIERIRERLERIDARGARPVATGQAFSPVPTG